MKKITIYFILIFSCTAGISQNVFNRIIEDTIKAHIMNSVVFIDTGYVFLSGTDNEYGVRCFALTYCGENGNRLWKHVFGGEIFEYWEGWNGNFKNVMKRNLPVSNNVSPYLSERLETLPNGISRQLIPLMANNPNYTTPAAVEKQINFLALEEQLFINKVIGYLLDTAINDKESALHLIASLDTESSKQILYSNYLLEGNYNEAEAILQTMDRSSEAIDDWVALNEILLSLYQNNNSVYDMDSSEIAFVRNLAYKCPSGRASSGARAIIHLLFGEEVPDCVFMNNRSATKLIKDVEFVMPDCDAYIEDNFPDPFTNYTLINYYLPEDTEGRIVVTDMLGRIMAEYNLIIGENTLEIRNNNWASGVYSYGMIVNGKAIEFKKMIINR
ncbi:MAG: T9SS type A sorting domain-containing protein [Bacteroidales bacterium]|nr:T9SS type A sorting domain-containing protein [Bacteroidales bacterium]